MNLTENYSSTINFKDMPLGTKLVITELSNVAIKDNIDYYSQYVGSEVTFEKIDGKRCSAITPVCSECEMNRYSRYVRIDGVGLYAACYFRFKTLTGKRIVS
jgi:hypothetical protein